MYIIVPLHLIVALGGRQSVLSDLAALDSDDTPPIRTLSISLVSHRSIRSVKILQEIDREKNPA